MQTIKIIATGLPASVEDYQLALNAAFAGGKAYGENSTKIEFKRSEHLQYTEQEISTACCTVGIHNSHEEYLLNALRNNRHV